MQSRAAMMLRHTLVTMIKIRGAYGICITCIIDDFKDIGYFGGFNIGNCPVYIVAGAFCSGQV